MIEDVQPKKLNWGKIIPWSVSGLLAVALGATLYLNYSQAFERQTVATVDGVTITRGDLYKDLKKQYGKETLDTRINQALVDAEAKKQNIKITDADIDKAEERIRAQFTSADGFNSMLTQYNLTLAELRDQLKTQLVIEKLLADKIAITDAEYKTQFDAMKKEKVDAGQIRASHILVKTEKEAKDILAKINAGDDFAKLAKKHSTDTGSGEQGGDLGYFAKADMVKPFSDAAFALKKGQVSGIVQSEFGYHIIQVTDTPSTWTLEEKRADVKDEIVSSKLNESVATYLEELKKKAKIKKSL